MAGEQVAIFTLRGDAESAQGSRWPGVGPRGARDTHNTGLAQAGGGMQPWDRAQVLPSTME